MNIVKKAAIKPTLVPFNVEFNHEMICVKHLKWRYYTFVGDGGLSGRSFKIRS